MVIMFDQDGCLHAAVEKWEGKYAAAQYAEAQAWATNLASRVQLVEERSEDLPERLRNLRQQGRLAIAVGAGVSMSCGLPSWYELVHTVAKKILSREGLREEEIESVLKSVPFINDQLALAQAVSALVPETEIASVVASVLYAKEPKPSELLDSLIELIVQIFKVNRSRGQPTVVLIFNYDTLVEEGLARRNCEVVSKDGKAHVGEVGSDAIVVIHPHGIVSRSRDEKTTIILTEASYGDVYLREPARNPLSGLLELGFVPLFVGFSFRDHFVRQILQQFFIKFTRPVAVGLLAEADRVIRLAPPIELGFSPNDEVGWRKAGLDPLAVRHQTVELLPSWFMRWVLFSIGVEWYKVDKREHLPAALAAITN